VHKRPPPFSGTHHGNAIWTIQRAARMQESARRAARDRPVINCFHFNSWGNDMQLYRLTLATLALIVAFCLPSAAQAPQAPQPWTQVGSSVCKVVPNMGFISAGHQPMQCTYTPSLAPAPPQYYDGAINTVGIDVGVSAGSVLAWGVFAPTTGLR